MCDLSNKYIKSKKLEGLNFGTVKLLEGNNLEWSKGLRGHYISRDIYTVNNGCVGTERIFTDIVSGGEGEKSLFPKRTNLSNKTDLSPRFTTVGCTFEDSYKIDKFVVVGGIADAITVWNALGCPDDVCVLALVGEKNAAKLVKQLKHIKPDAMINVALDNDNKSRTGQISAIETGCPWVVPENGGFDWSDLYVNYGLSEVSRQLELINDPLPDFDMWKIEPYNGSGCRNKKRLIELLVSLKPDDAELIASVSLALFARINGELFTSFKRPIDLFNYIRALNPYLSAITANKLKERINKFADDLVINARSQITVEREVLARHDVKRFMDVSKSKDLVLRSNGLIAIKAPHGGGKTSIIGIPFFNAAKDRDEYVTVLAHLRTLVADLNSKFNTEHYADLKEQRLMAGTTFTEETTTLRQIAICLPSIVGQLEGLVKRTGVLIIDEVSQVLRMLAAKMKGMDNVLVYERLFNTVRNAEKVLVLDADLDTATIEFLEACRPDERFTIVEVRNPTPSQSGLSVDWCYGEGFQDHIYNIAHTKLEEGKRIIIATDSKDKTDNIYSLLKENLPDKKILIVTSDTTKKLTSDASKFMDNANIEAAKYDCVIHSPSIRSGVSITDVHFDYGFGMFGGSTILPQDCIQQLRRCRMIKHWFIGVDESFSSLLEDEELLTVQQDILSFDYGTFGHDFDALKNRLDIKENIAKNNFATFLHEMLNVYGFGINRINIDEITEHDSLTRYSKDKKEELKNLAISIDCPSKQEYDALLELTATTTKQQAQILSYRICSNCNISKVTEEWFSFYLDGGVRKSKNILWGLECDTMSESASTAASLHEFNKPRGEEVSKIIEMSGLLGEFESEEVDVNLASEIVDHVWSRKNRLIFLKLVSPQYADKKYKTKTVTKPKPEKPIQWLKSVLEKCGVYTKARRKSVKSGGKVKKESTLIVDQVKQDKVFHVAAHLLDNQAA